MTDPDRRRPADFEASGFVRPRRRRRVEPALVITAAAGLGLALAVLKPWGGEVEIPRPTPAPRAAESAGASALPAVGPADRATAAGIGAAFRPHDGWGIATVQSAIGRDSLGPFRERWWPAEPPGTDVPTPIELPDMGIVGLAVTAPVGQTPLDVRVFRLAPEGGWQWLDVKPAPTTNAADLAMLPPPTADGASGGTWPAGHYRFDLLMGEGIDRLDFDIGEPTATGLDPWYLPPLDAVVPSPGTSGSAPDGGAASTPRDPGVFAVSGGIARPIGGSPRGSSPTAAEAWADGSGGSSVGPSGITALGATLPTDAMDARGSIRRLVPDAEFAGPLARVVTATSGGPPATTVRFDLPVGTAYGAGVYVLELGWDGPDGAHAAIWSVEITPGSSWPVPPLLEAARRFRASSGRDALIAAVPPAAAQPVIAFPLPEAAGCDGPGILPQAVLGIGHHDGVTVDGVRLTRAGPLGKDVDVAVRRADAGPGLTLVVPYAAPAFTPGTYLLTVAEPDDLGHVRLCIADRYRG